MHSIKRSSTSSSTTYTLSNILPLKFQKLVTLSKPKWSTNQHQDEHQKKNLDYSNDNFKDVNGNSCNVDIQQLEEGGDWRDMELPRSNHTQMTRRKISSQISTESPHGSPSNKARRRRRNPKSKPRKSNSNPSTTSSNYCRLLFLLGTSVLLYIVYQNTRMVQIQSTPNTSHIHTGPLMAEMDFETVFQIPFSTHTLSSTTSCSTPLSPDQIEFTFVTQLSMHRLWMLHHHCQRWGSNHFMSIAIYTNSTYDDLLQQVQEVAPSCDLDYLTIQLIPSNSIPIANYPINSLRNLAIAGVSTSHFLYADIDFFGNFELYNVLHSSSSKLAFSQDPQLAAVIPALAYKRACADENDCLDQNLAFMPKTPLEVYQNLKEINAWPFDPYNKGGHGSTKLWEWCQQEEGSFLSIDCFGSNRYEPYVAVRKCHTLPPFQEQFTGYGKNKLTQIMHMRHTGYQFAQLGGAFLVHYPHKDSGSRLEWDKVPKELEFDRTAKHMREARDSGVLDTVEFTKFKRGQIDALFVHFRKWLREEVEGVSRVPLCHDAMDDDAKLWVLDPQI